MILNNLYNAQHDLEGELFKFFYLSLFNLKHSEKSLN